MPGKIWSRSCETFGEMVLRIWSAPGQLSRDMRNMGWWLTVPLICRLWASFLGNPCKIKLSEVVANKRAMLKIRKTFTGLTYKLLSSLTVISDDYMSFILDKTTFTRYCMTQWISKLPGELWNPLSKELPGKFHGSGRHSKCNCLSDRANFHRSPHGKFNIERGWNVC